MGFPTCDHTAWGMPYTEVKQAQGFQGEVEVIYRFTWDGISQKPECNGPLIYIKATNNSSVTYYAHFLGKKGTPVTVSCAPGQVIEESRANFLRNMGLQTAEDAQGMYITTNRTPPPTLLGR